MPTGAFTRGSATIACALAAPSVRSIRHLSIALQVSRRAEQRPLDTASSGRLHGHEIEIELEIIEAHAAPASLHGSLPLACRTFDKRTRRRGE